MADSVIQRVIVALGVDPKEAREGLRDAEKQFQGFANVVRGFQEKAGGFAFDKLKAGLSALPSALTEATNRVIGLGDKFGDLATQTGVGTTALQKLEYAGKLSGVSLEQSLGSMSLMTRKLAEGTVESSAAFSRLGLSASSLKSMGADEAMGKVLEQIQKIPNQADRAGAAIGIFGRSGAVMLRFAGDMKTAGDQAQKLGMVLSEDTIAGAAMLDDEITTLSSTWEGFMNNLVSVVVESQAVHDFINGLTVIFAELSAGVNENKGAFQGLVQGGLMVFLQVLAFGGAVVTGFFAILQGVVEIATGFTIAMAGAAESTLRFLAAVENAFGVTELGQSLLNSAEEAKQFSASVLQVGDGISEGLGKAKDVAAGLTVKFFDLSQNLGKGKVALDGVGTAGQKTAASLNVVSESARKATEAAQKIGEAIGRDLASAKSSGLDDLSQAFTEIDSKIKEVANNLQDELKKGADPKVVGELQKKLVELGATLRENAEEANRLKYVGETFDDIKKRVDQTVVALLRFKAAGGSMSNLATASLKKMGEELSEISDKAPEAADALAEVNAALSSRGEEPIVSAESAKQFEQMGAAVKAYFANLASESEKATARQKEYIAALSQVGGLVASIGGMFKSGSWGSAIGNMGSSLSKGISSYGSAKTGGQKAQAGVAAGNTAMDIYKESKQERSGGKRALNGAAKGAAAGAAFGPYGVVIGAIAGAAIGFFSGPKWANTAKAAGKVFGTEVSNELAETIYKDKKKFGVSDKDASLLNLNAGMDEAMKATGKSVKDFGPLIMDTMALAAKGGATAAKAIAEVGQAFEKVKTAAKEGVGDKLMVQMIQGAAAANLKVPEIAAAVTAALDKAISGVGGMIAGIPLTNEADVQAQAVIMASTFWAKVKADGVVEAALAFGDIMTTWNEKFAAAGIEMNAATAAILAPLQQIAGLASNEMTRPILEGIGAMQDALGGLADSGFMTGGAFDAFGQQAGSVFEQLKGQGIDSNTALMAIAPMLSQLKEAAANYGYELDANTQSLIGQAEAAGIAFPVDPMLQVVDVLTAIAVKLGADIPSSVQKTTESLNGMGAAGSDSMKRMGDDGADATTRMGESGAAASTQMGAAGQAAMQTFRDSLSGMGEAGGESMKRMGEEGAAAAVTVGEASQSAMEAFEGATTDSMSSILMKFEETNTGIAGSFEDMVTESGLAMNQIIADVSSLDGLSVTIPVNYESNGAPEGGNGTSTGGGGETSQNPKMAASGYDAYLKSDALFKAHRGERVSIMPINGASPMSREIAGDVARAVAGATGAGAGGGPIHIEVHIGPEKLYEMIHEASKTRAVRIHPDAVTEQ